ncbi:hypothetical protein ACFVVA_37025 [Kitasatospora sp. NPDC058048]|uniref:hypothetical protein n=1 Tax=Kitasatospora sp. NPDC058048 TaxID=3346313 RepID=UPI0036D79887
MTQLSDLQALLAPKPPGVCRYPDCSLPTASGDGAGGRPPGFCDDPEHSKASAHRRRTEIKKLIAGLAAEAPVPDDPERPVEMGEIRGRDLLREAGRLLVQQQRTSTEQATVYAALIEQLQTISDPEAAAAQIQTERAEHAAELTRIQAQLAEVERGQAELVALREEAEAAAEEAAAADVLWLLVALNALRREEAVRAEAAERVTEAQAEAAAKILEVEEKAAAEAAEAAKAVAAASETVEDAKAALVAARTKAAEQVATATAQWEELQGVVRKEKSRADDLQRRHAGLTEELATERAEARDARQRLRQEYAEERAQFEQQLSAAVQRAADANAAADELRRELTRTLLPVGADTRAEGAAEGPHEGAAAPTSAGTAAAEEELIAAAHPYVRGATKGVNKTAREVLYRLGAAVSNGAAGVKAVARADAAALAANPPRMPDTPEGRRLGAALEAYAAEHPAEAAVPPAAAGAAAEAELLAAAEPFLTERATGLSQRVHGMLDRLTVALQHGGEPDQVRQVRRDIGALHVSSLKLPDTADGTRLRRALDAYTGTPARPVGQRMRWSKDDTKPIKPGREQIPLLKDGEDS